MKTVIPKSFSEKDKARFWAKVNKTPSCWLWTAGLVNGYGTFGINYMTLRSNRVSYALHKGPIPKGLQVCHSCDNPACVNPDHLFLGTNHDNVLDKVKKKRQAKGEKSALSKLKESDILAIRKMNVRQEDIAKKFNIDQSNVSYIKSGKTWKHI